MTLPLLPEPYVARFRLTPGAIATALFAAAMAGISYWLAVRLGQLALVDHPFWWLVAGLGVFWTWGAVNWVEFGLTHRLALRVDEYGITFGRGPMRSLHTVSVRWSDIREVVAFRDPPSVSLEEFGRMSYLGVGLRAGAARPRGEPRTEADVASQIVGWRLEEDRLIDAVRRYAPGIAVTSEL